MHRTERKTEQTRQPERDLRQNQLKQSLDATSQWAQTAQAILAGGSWGQLSAERILSLSGAIGNRALTELFEMRETGPEMATRPLPRGECTTAPLELPQQGGPLLAPQPVGSAAGPIGNAQPLTL